MTDAKTTDTRPSSTSESSSIFRQPTAVWAIAFACAISFMGIGLVDPILPAISEELGASPSQTMLLFTSYLFITGVAMIFTSWVSGRIGVRNTLLIGLVLVVIFAAAAGLSGSVNEIIGFRAGWGLGNALFISTALAAIVGAASGGSAQAIVLYEAALGVGMAVGPLIGGSLGSISWRGPFFGTAILMLIALVAILIFLRSPKSTDGASSNERGPSIWAGFRALRHPALRALAIIAVFYNFGFFTLLAYSPYPMAAAAESAGIPEFGARELGLVFFGWGLALAITSVFVAPVLTRLFGLRPVLMTMLILLALCLVALAVFVHSLVALISVVVASGLLLGIMNTALTETVMEATDLPRNIASSTYSAVRFVGGAVAPAIAGPLAVSLGSSAPYWVGAAAIVVSLIALLTLGGFISQEQPPHDPIEEAAAVGVGDGV